MHERRGRRSPEVSQRVGIRRHAFHAASTSTESNGYFIFAFHGPKSAGLNTAMHKAAHKQFTRTISTISGSSLARRRRTNRPKAVAG
jgi:hypothetical protein